MAKLTTAEMIEAITAPKSVCIPYSFPIRIIGLRGAKEEPKIMGYLDPASFPIPIT